MSDNIVNVYFPEAIQGPPAPPRKEVITGVFPAHTVIGINGSGNFVAANGTVAAAGKGIIGMLAAESVDGQAAVILTSGKVSDDGWEWTPGIPVYCGAAGVPTQNREGLAFHKVIGVAITATVIELNLGLPTAFLENDIELQLGLDSSGGLVAKAPPEPSGGGATERTVTLGATVTGYTVVQLDDDGQAQIADATQLALVAVIGIIVPPGTQGETAVVRSTGIVSNSEWDFSQGPVFVGAQGALTQDITGLAWIKQVGNAINAHDVELNFGSPAIKQGAVSEFEPLAVSASGQVIAVQKSDILGELLLNIDADNDQTVDLTAQDGFTFGTPFDLSSLYANERLTAGVVTGLVSALNAGKRVQVTIAGSFEVDTTSAGPSFRLYFHLDSAFKRFGFEIILSYSNAGEIDGDFSATFTIVKIGDTFFSEHPHTSLCVVNQDGSGSIVPFTALIRYQGRYDQPAPPVFDGHLYFTAERLGGGSPTESILFNLRQLTITSVG